MVHPVEAATPVASKDHIQGRTRRRAVTRAAVVAAVIALVCAVLFVGYLRMARVAATNSDGAAIAMQAWDLLHGNVLLHRWTLSDVSFYTTELAGQALVEAVVGLHADAVHVATALTYTVLVLLVVALARGRARGVEAALRMGVAAAFMLAPAPSIGYVTMLSSADHTGTGIPLLLTWLVLERSLARSPEPGGAARWRLPAAIAAMLAWGQIADPLVLYTGALPLLIVAGWRLAASWRRNAAGGSRPHLPWRQRLAGLRRSVGLQRPVGLEARLLLAAPVSLVLAKAFEAAIRAAGGFRVPPTVIQISPLPAIPGRVLASLRATTEVYGGYLPDRHGALSVAVGVVHLIALPMVAVAVGVVLYRAVRRAPVPAAHGAVPAGGADPDARAARAARDWFLPLLAVGILVNIAAYAVSTLPVDLNGCREIVAILPLGAVLSARVWSPWLRRVRAGRLAVASLAALACVTFAVQAVATAGPVGNCVGQQEADWLVANGYRYGLGTYWYASSTTLASSGRVRVIPFQGAERLAPYHWESRSDWFDPARHDARFVLVDLRLMPPEGVAPLTEQFGPPVRTQRFGPYVMVLVYDHNILYDVT